jgi:peptidyl-prolyl cis-trans isomerase SurA
MKIKILILVFFFLGVGNIFSQISEGQSLDRIVAVIGKEIVLQSEIDGEMARMMQQNAKINFQDLKLRDQVLERIISEKLIVTKAIEDSIEVSDDEVSQRWNEFLSTAVRQYGSEKRLEEVFGKSINRVKFEYLDLIKKKLLSEKLIQSKFATLTVSQKDVEEFYTNFKDSLEMVPEKVAIYNIIKYVKANKAAKEDVFEFAKKLRDSIVTGGNFGYFAKTYSADPGSAQDSGKLGWFDKGKLMPEFEKAAFALQKGETSMPVETPFGYHIIQTLDKKKESIYSRHILLKIGQTDSDKDTVKNTLLEIKRKVAIGFSFEELAKLNSDDQNTKGFGGFIGKLPLEEMPASLREIVVNMKSGEVSDPLPYSLDPSKQGFQVIYKKEVIPAHKASLETDAKTIEQYATVIKKQKALQNWVNELKNEIYWEKK